MFFNRLKSLVILGMLSFAAYAQEKTLLTVYFDHNKAAIREEAITMLDRLIARYTPGMIPAISLNGHCDGSGSDAYNLILSRKRVYAVRAYLQKAGVSPSVVVSAVGYGERKPLNENATEEERQANRRVEITITSKTITLKERIAGTDPVAGTTIVLKNINFYGGMHRFLPESNDELAELLDAMNAYPALVIRIEGHICCESHPGDGLDTETGLANLSEARAKAVMDYLVSNGIDPERVSHKGFGHSIPLFPYPEKSEEERMANRRVEIKIVGSQ